MQRAADTFTSLIAGQPDVHRMPPPAVPPRLVSCATPLVWDNAVWSAPGFRRAHLEHFAIPGQFAVLHLCIFPHLRGSWFG